MTWLTVKEAAQALRMTERAVQIAVQQSRFEYCHVKGVGRGGKQLRIALESLPDDAQARYHGEQAPELDILQFTGKQREGADFRALVVTEYQRSGLSPEEYVLTFNAENPPEDAITTSRLFRWQRQYRQGGIAALVDQRGGHNRGQDTIPAEAWDMQRLVKSMRSGLQQVK